MFLQLLASFFILFILPLLFILFKASSQPPNNEKTTTLPKSYPIIGSILELKANRHRRIQWFADIVLTSPTNTFTLNRALGNKTVFTANPAIVQHVLKTHFSIYEKGPDNRGTLHDFLGNGIFNTDGETWKFQRQVASHEFNTRSLRKFVETVVDTELTDRLIPILATIGTQKKVIDFQDILQRFAFDNICRIAFGFDPEYLSPSLEERRFAQAFEEATEFSGKRFGYAAPIFWKLQRLLNFGNEKKLRAAVAEVREVSNSIVREKKRELGEKDWLESQDMLSRFLSSGHSDEDFVTNIVISFILAGKDTTSAALTWFFWLLSKNPEVENKIVKEIREKSEAPVYDEVKDMVYTHAALCESMRLYPPVPMDTKQAKSDDVLPNGTVVKKGTRLTYHVYAMGRLEEVWGKEWEEYRPERWLEKVAATSDSEKEKWNFVGKDSFSYPVFQAGPRICLGKEMAFLQMKRMVAGILRRFRVVPAFAQGVEPEYVSFLTAKMKGGFPVRIEERVQT